jgi:hypothetical protein
MVKGIKLVVKKNYLKYRIPGVNGGESFIPKIGDMIILPKEVAKVELNSGNVRRLLPEEKEAMAKNVTKKRKVKKAA